MNFTISVEKLHEQSCENDYIPDPQEALNILEELRLQSGKFIYEYPARLRKVVKVIRKK